VLEVALSKIASEYLLEKSTKRIGDLTRKFSNILFDQRNFGDNVKAFLNNAVKARYLSLDLRDIRTKEQVYSTLLTIIENFHQQQTFESGSKVGVYSISSAGKQNSQAIFAESYTSGGHHHGGRTITSDSENFASESEVNSLYLGYAASCTSSSNAFPEYDPRAYENKPSEFSFGDSSGIQYTKPIESTPVKHSLDKSKALMKKAAFDLDNNPCAQSREAYSAAMDNLESVFTDEVDNDIEALEYQTTITLRRQINRIRLAAASELESIIDYIRFSSPEKKFVGKYQESDHEVHVQDEEIEASTRKRSREWVSLDEDRCG